MSKNSRKVTQKPEGRFVNGACELYEILIIEEREM